MAACRRPAFGLSPRTLSAASQRRPTGQPAPTYLSAEQRRASAAQALALPQLSGRRQAAPVPAP